MATGHSKQPTPAYLTVNWIKFRLVRSARHARSSAGSGIARKSGRAWASTAAWLLT
jgi:hypothetical protein